MSGSPRDDDWARDDWPEAPDAWARADREWKEKWTDKAPEADDASGDAPEPPRAGYTPQKASVRAVADGYEEGMREAGPYITIGLQIAASMLLFVGGGWALDDWAGTSPWGLLVGAVLGFLGVMALVIRLSNEANAKR
ncbi:MAG: AtpZ/AtpI family protein [Bacteroidota bacterium]